METTVQGVVNDIIRLNDTAAYGPGFLAIGHDFAGGFKTAAVWVSPDGRTWTRVASSPASSFPGGSEMLRIVRVPSGSSDFITVGDTANSATVWKLTGTSWNLTAARFNDESGVQLPDSQIWLTGVTFSLSSVFAYGHRTVGSLPRAAIWMAKDPYTTWTQVYLEPTASSTCGSQVKALKPVSSGWFTLEGGPALIAVGYVDQPYCKQNAMIWSSTDGYTWTKLLSVGDPTFVLLPGGNQVLNDLDIHGSGIWVAGSDSSYLSGPSPQKSVLWLSEDKGATWNRITTTYSGTGPAFADPHVITRLDEDVDVPPFAFGTVGIGHIILDPLAPPKQDGAYWGSQSGYPVWQNGRPPELAGPRIDLLATAHGDNVWVVGGRSGSHGAIWTFAEP